MVELLACILTKFLEHSVEITFRNQEENFARLKFQVFNDVESSSKLCGVFSNFSKQSDVKSMESNL